MAAPERDIRDLVEQFVKEMAGAIQARGMYGAGHKLSREAVARLAELLAGIFAERDEVIIGIIGEEIAFEKEPLYELNKTAGGFIAHLKEVGIEKITLLRAPSDEELGAFLDILARNPKSIAASGGLDKLLQESSVTHIAAGRISWGRGRLGEAVTADLSSMARGVFQDGEQCLRKTFDDITQNKQIDISAARFFVIKLIGNLAKNKHSLIMLTSIKSHDEYTFIHSINVAIFAVVQAEALGLGERALTEIGMAGLLHDAGKLVLPGDILRKPGGLDEHDIEEIHKHPVDGAKLLLQSLESSPLAAIAAFEHHIKYDQTGYPSRLFGGNVNPASMMVTIADVYDALRSKRAYHEDMAPEKTYEEMMKLSGTSFDPKLLSNFFQIVGVYPPGTVVELDDHSIGIVLRQSSLDIRRPQVEILYDADGRKAAESRIINLLEKDRGSGAFKWTILKSIAPGKYQIPEKFKV